MSETITEERVAPEVSRGTRLGYIPALDGLRAVAVVAVLLYHDNDRRVPGGFLGVDVFFVISGYLITCLLLADYRTHGRIDFKRFWIRRARRLLPALFLLLGVVSVYALVFLPDEVAKLRGAVVAALAYVENWYLILRHVPYAESVGRPPLLQHVWSLAVEEQFYLLWPLILAGGLKLWGPSRRLLVAILGGVVVSTVLMAVLYAPYTDPSRVYYGTDTRAATILVGAALAFVWAPWRLSRRTGPTAPILYDLMGVVGLVGLVWAFLNVHFYDQGMYRGGYLLVALVSALAVAATVHPAARLVPLLLGLAPFRWIGVRSYGIYLWHWPVFMVTRPHLDVGLTGLPLLALRLVLTFAIAELSFRYVEEPIRHGAIGHRIATMRAASGEERRRLTTGFVTISAAVTVSVVVVAVAMIGSGPAPQPAGVPKVASAVIDPSKTPASTQPGATTTTVAPAPSGLVAGRVTMIGDSVMLGARNALAATFGDRLYLDAAENRQFGVGVLLIQLLKDQGKLGDEVVVQLGTNGLINPTEFDTMMNILAPAKRVVLVNAQVPRGWQDEVNGVLADGAKRYKNAVLLDWHNLSLARPDVFYNDGIHLRPAGADYYAQLVAGALGAP